jgi:hypothetical protein
LFYSHHNKCPRSKTANKEAQTEKNKIKEADSSNDCCRFQNAKLKLKEKNVTLKWQQKKKSVVKSMHFLLKKCSDGGIFIL